MTLWDIISYNKGKGSSDGNNYWRSCRTPHYVYISLMLVLLGIGIGLVSLFACSIFPNELGTAMFASYFSEPELLILNIAPCVLLVVLLYLISGRAWIAVPVSAAVAFIMSAVNYYKMQFRSEPFTAADFAVAGEAAGMLGNYSLGLSGRIIALIAAFIVFTLISALLMRGKLRAKLVRILGTLLVLAIMAGLFFGVYTNQAVYDWAKNDTADFDEWSETEVYISKGFLFSFIHSVTKTNASVPEVYSEPDAASILAGFEPGVIPEGEKINIITIMLESYSDLSVHPGLTVDESVYAPFHRLQAESIYGNIVSNSFGGTTIDSERAFLTGYPHLEHYEAPVNSHVRWFRDNGYTAEGWHPGAADFYNRQNVQSYLGFENYYFIEDFPDGNIWDNFFFPQLTRMYDERDKDTPYFNFSITYQNHGAYTDSSPASVPYLEQGDLTDGAYNILSHYLFGIADTSARLEKFIDSLRDDPEPVAVILFGDHMPWLGDASYVYHELGINISLGEREGFLNNYSVPYIIWANDAAKEATGGDFTGYGGDISACYLMNLLVNECGWSGSSYMQVLESVRELVPVISVNTGLYISEGEFTDQPTGEAADRLNDLILVEYYTKQNYLYGGQDGQ